MLLCSPYPAWACSCGPVGIYRGHKHAAIVFTGTLVAAKASFFNDTLGLHQGKYVVKNQRIVRFTFKIQRLYKGTITADTISLSTSAGGADCGNNFTLSKRYLIYSWFTDALPNDFRKEYRKVTPYLTTHLCSRTKPDRFLNFYEKAVLSLL